MVGLFHWLGLGLGLRLKLEFGLFWFFRTIKQLKLIICWIFHNILLWLFPRQWFIKWNIFIRLWFFYKVILRCWFLMFLSSIFQTLKLKITKPKLFHFIGVSRLERIFYLPFSNLDFFLFFFAFKRFYIVFKFCVVIEFFWLLLINYLFLFHIFIKLIHIICLLLI